LIDGCFIPYLSGLKLIFMERNLLKFVVAAFGILISTGLFGQDYVITIQGDTLKGEVKALTYSTDKKVQITEPGKKKVVFPFFKVKVFTIEDELYQPMKGPDGYTFMKVIKTGYLSLYAFQMKNQTGFDGMYLAKLDGSGMEVPNLTFKKGMKKFLDDCPSVTYKIENDQLNKRDLHKIVDEYNECVKAPAVVHTPAAPVVAAPVVAAPAPVEKSSSAAWNTLEEKVKAQPDFEGKADALEMIGEIKSKMAASQKVPNFLIEGLKTSLNQDVFKTELENALKEIH